MDSPTESGQEEKLGVRTTPKCWEVASRRIDAGGLQEVPVNSEGNSRPIFVNSVQGGQEGVEHVIPPHVGNRRRKTHQSRDRPRARLTHASPADVLVRLYIIKVLRVVIVSNKKKLIYKSVRPTDNLLCNRSHVRESNKPMFLDITASATSSDRQHKYRVLNRHGQLAFAHRGHRGPKWFPRVPLYDAMEREALKGFRRTSARTGTPT